MKTPHQKAPSPAPLPIKQTFVKGCHYENMKGAYEVLSVDGNTMRIRWESGEECVTDVALQEKILDRIEREVLVKKARLTSRDEEEAEARLAPQSRGLSAADFCRDLSKTTWRSRSPSTAATRHSGSPALETPREPLVSKPWRWSPNCGGAVYGTF